MMKYKYHVNNQQEENMMKLLAKKISVSIFTSTLSV